jgi:hypothetical protein
VAQLHALTAVQFAKQTLSGTMQMSSPGKANRNEEMWVFVMDLPCCGAFGNAIMYNMPNKLIAKACKATGSSYYLLLFEGRLIGCWRGCPGRVGVTW